MIRLSRKGLLYRGRWLPVEIGRGGITDTKVEGDGATPAGRLHITGMLYRPDRIAPPQPWAQPIGPRDLWCDAPEDPQYNQQIAAPFAASHEALRRPDPLYDIVLLTDWNHPKAIPGKGSAIFVHQRRRAGYPTAGCLALRRDHLIWIARTITRGAAIEIPFILAKISRGDAPSGAGGQRPPLPRANRDKA
ncbi:hypothetical protein FGG78_00570 [Thioclava sp. BHET1]|nr:hypothetical protein FGG78_00570 [Thioclava sp. BHET1]